MLKTALRVAAVRIEVGNEESGSRVASHHRAVGHFHRESGRMPDDHHARSTGYVAQAVDLEGSVVLDFAVKLDQREVGARAFIVPVNDAHAAVNLAERHGRRSGGAFFVDREAEDEFRRVALLGAFDAVAGGQH